ncbi:SRPBCC domain-containing protein [Ferrovibrio sp.]|uniref:SRPBCC family protein n=1 Tax=Ferrovibrio sp. TaxID=1917215 RepID=UPI000CC55AC8|nr:SRPBCC domain-containing protein [Ferrovibrio sp.]PJI43749.1 MAG: hypothetical protein CTR53_01670 [Ferrovibrio sp.]
MSDTDKTPDLVLNRVFNASSDRVFRAWIDPQLLAQWWGPQGWTAPVCELDPRPGGAWLVHMRSPEGHVQVMGGTYHEIEPAAKIAYTTFVKEGERFMVEGLHVVTLEALPDGRTKLRMETTLLQLAPEWESARHGGMQEGTNSSLDKLEAMLTV